MNINMKALSDKIKQEHTILKEFYPLLNQIAEIDEVKRIIPGRISRKQQGSSLQAVSISYQTDSGLKCLIKKGSTAQELFITCSAAQTDSLETKLEQLFS